MKHDVEAWKRYTDFKGRSSRAAYWWPFLLTIVISFWVAFLPPFSEPLQMRQAP